jgi:hypothetical protein
LLVGVGDPGHLLRAGSEVGRGYVNAWADHVALHEFVCVAARDAFQFGCREVGAVDLNGALRAAKRQIHKRAFVGH